MARNGCGRKWRHWGEQARDTNEKEKLKGPTAKHALTTVEKRRRKGGSGTQTQMDRSVCVGSDYLPLIRR